MNYECLRCRKSRHESEYDRKRTGEVMKVCKVCKSKRRPQPSPLSPVGRAEKEKELRDRFNRRYGVSRQWLYKLAKKPPNLDNLKALAAKMAAKGSDFNNSVDDALEFLAIFCWRLSSVPELYDLCEQAKREQARVLENLTELPPTLKAYKALVRQVALAKHVSRDVAEKLVTTKLGTTPVQVLKRYATDT